MLAKMTTIKSEEYACGGRALEHDETYLGLLSHATGYDRGADYRIMLRLCVAT